MKLVQSFALASTQGDLIAEGLVTLVVGMSVVFLALLILVVILELSGKFFDSLKKKDNNKELSTPVVDPAIEAPTTATEIDDLELIAVITATIAASMGTSTDGFQVRSLRKTNNVWSMTGRVEQLYN
ncbi:MAG TPA: OadG family protein [Epulopiscium sp.]|nr:OadG family protein [Candidatus Epulonipiscium sp.]